MNVSWDTVARDLESDGALRDIYITPATRADWQRILHYVREHGTRITYTVDAKPAPLPSHVDEAFAARRESSPALGFWVGSIHFATHFFVEDEVELDFRPDDIQGPAEFQSLLDFVRAIGDLLSKPVSVTPESHRQEPFLVYQPSSHDFQYLPLSDRNA